MEFNVNTCSGCMACMNICPKDAISIIESAEGFIIPQINETKCVHCGLCETVCDYKKDEHYGRDIMRAFSLKHHDKKIVDKSSSGGAFTALSDKILEKNGVVIGAVYDNDFNVIQIASSSNDERDSMRGSKYVQSNPNMIYREVKSLLDRKNVMFVGTPCQCAGLTSYLKKDYDNLFIVDFLCHGVPSNKMFKEHIGVISNHHKGKAVNYTFRTKKYGWNSYANVITFAELFQDHNSYAKKNSTIEDSSWLTQSFLTFFSNSLSLRPSCFNCPYRNYHRPSDITIGDFWQIEQLTGKKDKDGVSFITANSLKGEELISEVINNVQIKEYSIEQVKFRLPSGTTPKPKGYEDFWNTYLACGYEQVVQKYFDNSFKAKTRWEIKKIAKRLRLI